MPGFKEYDVPQESPKANDLSSRKLRLFKETLCRRAIACFFQTSPNGVASVLEAKLARRKSFANHLLRANVDSEP
jgi:hypothetical protein